MPLTKRELMISGLALPFAERIFAAGKQGRLKEQPMNALSHIRQIDYTVIFARDMPRMQEFYSGTMGFPVLRKLGDGWIEFGVGSNRLALTTYGLIFNDEPPARGALSMQMAFRVPPAEVEKCASALKARDVELVAPVTDQAWGHRTVFFRDPDGNIIEIYADI